MIYKAEMTVGKKTGSVWLVGESTSGFLTGAQRRQAHHELMVQIGTHDQFSNSDFFERKHDGSLDFESSGNHY